MNEAAPAFPVAVAAMAPFTGQGRSSGFRRLLAIVGRPERDRLSRSSGRRPHARAGQAVWLKFRPRSVLAQHTSAFAKRWASLARRRMSIVPLAITMVLARNGHN